MARKRKTKLRQRIISNMGLFWHRDKVRWIGNRTYGHAKLLGRRSKAKTKGDVDFWKQTAIYALYKDYELVYVGQGGIGDQSCLGKRLKSHLSDGLADRWDMFSWFGLRKVNKNNKLGTPYKLARATQADLANLMEGVLIEVAEPPLNSQKGRFGEYVERYLQKDESTDDLMNAFKKMEAKIIKKLEKLKAKK